MELLPDTEFSNDVAISSFLFQNQDAQLLKTLLAKGDYESARKVAASAVGGSDQSVLDILFAHMTNQSGAGPSAAETKAAAKSDAAGDVIKRVEAAIAAIREGKFVVVNDGEDRENEGDLIIAAEKATAEKLAFMVNETSGLICIGLQGERIDELQLPQMVQRNTESHQTAFTVSVDYKVGTSTGISAADRAATIRALADRKVGTEDFSKPGHMFPLRAKPGGVLERPGHTESSVDLARLAGLFPAAAMCEIVNKDGSMMRPDACRRFAEQHGLPCISIADLVAYRKVKDPLSSLPASKVAPAQAASAASAEKAKSS